MPSEWSLAAKKAVFMSFVCPLRISSPMMTIPASDGFSELLLELNFAEELAYPLS